MKDRIIDLKAGVKEKDLRPARGIAYYIAEIRFFKYVLLQANKIEKSMQIADSFAVIYMYIFTCVCVCVCVCVCACACLCVFVCLFLCVCVCMCVNVNVCMHC